MRPKIGVFDKSGSLEGNTMWAITAWGSTLFYPLSLLREGPKTRNSELRTQNSELRTQNSELRTQNSEAVHCFIIYS
ncbi:MAG: hypothetical protein MI674_02435 [Cytophagales bacterium]|nr:hypothetical protein [Cytophagales bacterium]